jgi:hypothetical protein
MGRRASTFRPRFPSPSWPRGVDGPQSFSIRITALEIPVSARLIRYQLSFVQPPHP